MPGYDCIGKYSTKELIHKLYVLAVKQLVAGNLELHEKTKDAGTRNGSESH